MIWKSSLKGLEGIFIKYLIESISMDIKFFNAAGILIDNIISNLICLVYRSVGGVARVRSQEMYLMLVLDHPLYSFLMIILGNPEHPFLPIV